MQYVEIIEQEKARYWDQWWWRRGVPMAMAITAITALATTMVCQIAAYLLF